VQSSPFCRAIETAALAFGRHKVNNDLVFVMSSSAAEANRLADALKRMLATAPAKGTNTVLVSHSANLREAAGIFAKPEGAVYVFRPLALGGFTPVGRILPEEWATAARAATADVRP
jgi:broad specificity phosphatase PhoE